MTYPPCCFAAGAAGVLSFAARAARAETSDAGGGIAAAADAAAAAGTPAPLFSWGGYFQAIGFMCLLLALLWFAVWVVRRSGKFAFLPMPGALPRDALRMEAQLPLGAKKNLLVVRFLNKRLLLGVTDQRITLLKETELHDDFEDTDSGERSRSTPEQPGSARNAGVFFASLLERARTGEGGLEPQGDAEANVSQRHATARHDAPADGTR